MIQPRNDRVLIERIEEPPSGIILTDAPKSIKGKVLAVGPGKWIPGEWWLLNSNPNPCECEGRCDCSDRGWRWIDGHRQELTVKPGQIVYFSSKWNDFAGDHYDDLPIGANPCIHLLQEADILAIL